MHFSLQGWDPGSLQTQEDQDLEDGLQEVSPCQGDQLGGCGHNPSEREREPEGQHSCDIHRHEAMLLQHRSEILRHHMKAPLLDHCWGTQR